MGTTRRYTDGELVDRLAGGAARDIARLSSALADAERRVARLETALRKLIMAAHAVDGPDQDYEDWINCRHAIAHAQAALAETHSAALSPRG